MSKPKGAYIEKALPLTPENLIRITETDEQTIARFEKRIKKLSQALLEAADELESSHSHFNEKERKRCGWCHIAEKMKISAGCEK